MNREHTEVLMELNINGIMDTAYSYGDQRLTNERFTEWTGYYTYDPRGSVTGVTDDKGMIWQSYRYDAFGSLTFGQSQYNNVYTYNAESYNPNVDAQYLRARYYSPTTADFISEDSYLGDITDPLSLNRYNYVNSSPLNYMDPSGHVASNYLTGDAPESNSTTYPANPNAGQHTPITSTYDSELLDNGGALIGEVLGGLAAGAVLTLGAPVSLPIALFVIAVGAATGMVVGGTVQKNYQSQLTQKQIQEIDKLLKQYEDELKTLSEGGAISDAKFNSLQQAMEDLVVNKLQLCGDLEQYQEDIEGYEALGKITIVVAGVTMTLGELLGIGAVKTGVQLVKSGGMVSYRNGGVVDLSKIINSASQAKKGGETVAGHALQKHAGRNPGIWGKISGNAESINNAAMQHIDDILKSPGDFNIVKSNGHSFFEKMLSDGRGIRLNMDGTFKGFIDQVR